jgi:transcriptional regulator with XRE-family HTH domain
MRAQALVARNLRRLRVKRGLSQEALAADAGIDRTYVSCLERGLENPTVAMLEQLADALAAAIVEFFVVPAPASLYRSHFEVVAGRSDSAGIKSAIGIWDQRSVVLANRVSTFVISAGGGVQILAPRLRKDLCLDAGEAIEAAEGVVMPIDPVQ